MPSLFDQAFEDDRPDAEPTPPAAPQPPADPLPAAPPAPGAEAAKPPARRVLTVSELTAAIARRLEKDFFQVWLEGEISNARPAASGHLYFTLKDDTAQIRAVMFRSNLRLLRFKPADGQHVVARGQIEVYEARGEVQIVCQHLEPRGLGALQLAFEQLKRRLEAEGLFAAARKRPLPLLPRTIGIVTSLEGAAVRDIVRVVTNRHAGLRLLIRSCRVQGEDACHDVARAIRHVSRHPGVDVVIVARGGGSLEDLWAFNEEAVARAIAASPVPVVSGVGHETDTTIADFAADVRAATPSNAAEIVVARRDELARRIAHLDHRARAAVRQQVADARAGVHALTARRGLLGLQSRVAMRERRLAELAARLRRTVGRGHAAARQRLAALVDRLAAADQRRRLVRLRARLAQADARLAPAGRAGAHRATLAFGSLAGRLDALSPLAVLGRGYAVCFAADGRTVLRDATTARDGDTVHVRLEHGRLACTVTGRETTEDAGLPARPHDTHG
jgi:exodeoxyribonuclease VII large subunit